MQVSGWSPRIRRLQICKTTALFVWTKGGNLRFGRVLGGVFLQRFPLADEVAHLPHQRLVPVDQLLRRIAIVIEAGRGHRFLQLLDARLALGDADLEIGDALLQCFGRTLLFLALSLDALPVLTIVLWTQRLRVRSLRRT